MCELTMALAGISAAATGASYFEGTAAAAEAESARQYQQAAAEYNRRQVEEYNNEIYAQDISYAQDTLEFQQGEFARQRTLVNESVDAIRTDYIRQVGTLLTRAVEESIRNQLSGEEVIRAGRAGRAQFSAMGMEGVTARLLEGSIGRQEGEALVSIERNRQARERQLRLEALGLKAQGDTAINQIPIQVFQPISPPRPPAPTSPIAPTAPVRGPSLVGAVGSVVGQIGQGYVDTYQARGQFMPDSFRDTLLLRPGPAINP